VWFVDDDDYPGRETVRDVLRAISAPELAGKVLLLPRSKVLNGTQIHLDMPTQEQNKFDRYRRYGIEVTTSCAVFPREVVSGVGGWDESLRALQDTDLFLRVSKMATFHSLETEPVCIDVGEPTRITFAFKRSQVGKLQFLRKHWDVLPFTRKLRFIFSVLGCAPLTRNLRLRWNLARVRARAKHGHT
jgi:hypothetical protein